MNCGRVFEMKVLIRDDEKEKRLIDKQMKKHENMIYIHKVSERSKSTND